MTTPGELLSTSKLVVGFRTPLLSGLTVQFSPSEWWFVLGRNGAGKSTLLHTLAGLMPPLGGELFCVAGIANRSALGFVPQEPPLQPSLPMQLAEFLELGLADQRTSRKERDAAVAAVLVHIGLSGLGSRRWSVLSLGQRRRALIGRALLRKPSLMILDEPTTSLDPGTALQIVHDLDYLRLSRGLCLLHSSHDLVLAQRFATHLVVIDDGEAHVGPADLLFATGVVANALGTGALS